MSTSSLLPPLLPLLLLLLPLCLGAVVEISAAAGDDAYATFGYIAVVDAASSIDLLSPLLQQLPRLLLLLLLLSGYLLQHRC